MATYQAFVAPINDTNAHYKTWANFFGGGFSTIGWSAQTAHLEVTASGTGASYAWTDVGAKIGVSAIALAPVQAYRINTGGGANGSWNAGTAYTGSSTINSATVCDLVTYNDNGNTPITYVCVSSVTGGSNPQTDYATNGTTSKWQPYVYEIWKSNGSNTSSLPIYVRIVYGMSNQALTAGVYDSQPVMHFAIGTGVDANGNLTGALNLWATAPQTNMHLTTGQASTSNGVLNVQECDFAGDADNFRFIFCRGNALGTNPNFKILMMVLDRAKNADGTDSDGYATFATIVTQWSGAGGTGQVGSVGYLLKSTLGTVINPTLFTSGWTGITSSGGQTATMQMFGSSPPLPIFPVVGYVDNPLLGVMGFNIADHKDGEIYPVWIYGAAHLYLLNIPPTASAVQSLNAVSNSMCAGIRWE